MACLSWHISGSLRSHAFRDDPTVRRPRVSRVQMYRWMSPAGKAGRSLFFFFFGEGWTVHDEHHQLEAFFLWVDLANARMLFYAYQQNSGSLQNPPGRGSSASRQFRYLHREERSHALQIFMNKTERQFSFP